MKKIIWVEERDVLILHDRLLDIHGGLSGLRDQNLLRSALARPQQHHAYSTRDAVDLAAIYTAGLVHNHPFVDGNKRTGFVVGILFLELNGYRFTASEEAAATAVLALAAGTLADDEYAGFLRDHAVRSKKKT